MPIGSPSSSDAVAPERLEQLITRLTHLEAGDGWVVSCYLKLEPRDRQRGKYLIKLKNRMRERLDDLPLRISDRRVRGQAEGDLGRVQDYLGDSGNLPAGRGVAVFACRAAKLFEAVPLPRVFRSRLTVDRTPLVRELQAVRDEFGRVLCAVADRASARLFEITADGIRELPAIDAADSAPGHRFRGGRARKAKGSGGRVVGGAGLGEHNFHQRIKEERHRHYAAVADQLFGLTRRLPVQGVVLAGTGRDVAAVEPHLHPYVRGLVLDTVRLNPKTVEPGTVLEAVLRVRRERERTWERQHAAALQEGVATGWGIASIAGTLDALARGQVRTLLVAADVTRAGFRCRDSGRLTVLPDDCAGEGTGQPVTDVLDEAIEEALRQGAHVDVVEDTDARRAFDGLGALLRFPRR